jgi:hypothetical protein
MTTVQQARANLDCAIEGLHKLHPRFQEMEALRDSANEAVVEAVEAFNSCRTQTIINHLIDQELGICDRSWDESRGRCSHLVAESRLMGYAFRRFGSDDAPPDISTICNECYQREIDNAKIKMVPIDVRAIWIGHAKTSRWSSLLTELAKELSLPEWIGIRTSRQDRWVEEDRKVLALLDGRTLA